MQELSAQLRISQQANPQCGLLDGKRLEDIRQDQLKIGIAGLSERVPLGTQQRKSPDWGFFI